MEKVPITTETITLQAFLKWCGAYGAGGEAKRAVQEGLVRVNGSVETRRSATLRPGDRVEARGQDYLVGTDES